MSCLFSTGTCSARLYYAWFWLFSNTTESHLSLGGVVIARQPERAVISFACRTNTTQKYPFCDGIPAAQRRTTVLVCAYPLLSFKKWVRV